MVPCLLVKKDRSWPHRFPATKIIHFQLLSKFLTVIKLFAFHLLLMLWSTWKVQADYGKQVTHFLHIFFSSKMESCSLAIHEHLCCVLEPTPAWSALRNAAAAAAKSLQSCQILCDPIDCSPPGSPIPGILQARTLEWVAIFFSNAWKWKVKVKSLSRVRLLAIPQTAAYQAPPSMGFSRQEYWSGVPLPPLALRNEGLQITGSPADLQLGRSKLTSDGMANR